VLFPSSSSFFLWPWFLPLVWPLPCPLGCSGPPLWGGGCPALAGAALPLPACPSLRRRALPVPPCPVGCGSFWLQMWPRCGGSPVCWVSVLLRRPPSPPSSCGRLFLLCTVASFLVSLGVLLAFMMGVVADLRVPLCLGGGSSPSRSFIATQVGAGSTSCSGFEAAASCTACLGVGSGPLLYHHQVKTKKS
jgi:hypothetical protein